MLREGRGLQLKSVASLELWDTISQETNAECLSSAKPYAVPFTEASPTGKSLTSLGSAPVTV